VRRDDNGRGSVRYIVGKVVAVSNKLFKLRVGLTKTEDILVEVFVKSVVD